MLRKFFHPFDLTRSISPRVLLTWLFYIHVVGMFVYGYVMISELIELKKTSPEKLWYFIPWMIISFACFIVQIFLLWVARASKKYCQTCLRCFCLISLLASFIILPGFVYTRIWILKPDRSDDPALLALSGVSFIVSIFGVNLITINVYRISCKLKYPLLEKWKTMKLSSSKHELLEEQNIENVNVSDAQFREFIISPMNIAIDYTKIIGEGHFGSVYKGILKRSGEKRAEIAAKIVTDGDSSFEVLIHEVKIAIYVGKHENVVNFYGISSDSSLNADFVIISELCHIGSLESKLHDMKKTAYFPIFINSTNKGCKNLPFKQRGFKAGIFMELLRFAKQIASGMKHLASINIIHGDLATRNVLLSKDKTIKLTDFGLSRKLCAYQTYIRKNKSEELCLPWRWMALETLRDLKFSKETDVYSYGIVLWELFTLGCIPFGGLNWSSEIILLFQRGLKLEKPELATNEMYNIMKLCWDLEPQNRPTFETLLDMLNNTTISSTFR